MLLTSWLLVTGLSTLAGTASEQEEVLRGLAFLLSSFVYAGVWRAIAMVLSTHFRSPATSAPVTLPVWLLFTVFLPMRSPHIAGVALFGPLNPLAAVDAAQVQQVMSRISPNTLLGEMTMAILNLKTRSLGFVFASQLQQALLDALLPVSESLILIWPQLACMSATLLLFTLAYVSFQRQQIRA